MYPIHYILDRLRLLLDTKRTFRLDKKLSQTIEDFARLEDLPPEEIATGLLTGALVDRGEAEMELKRCRSLSFREKQVVALVCQGHANAEIAARLGISIHTVASHMHNVREKLDLRSKAEIRLALADWDFTPWLDSGS